MYIINLEYICTCLFFHKPQKTHALGNIFQIQLEVHIPTQITEALHRFHLLGDILRHFRSSLLYYIHN